MKSSLPIVAQLVIDMLLFRDWARTGRVRELTKSSRSKFKMVWHQVSTVQLPSNQIVWKVCSVQFGAWEPSASAQFVQFISRTLPALARIDLAGSVRLRLCSVLRVPNCLGGVEEQFWVPSSGNPSPPARVCRLGGGMVRLVGCACLLVWDVMRCQGDANSVQNRKKSSFSSVRLPDRSVQFGARGQMPPFSSFISVH